MIKSGFYILGAAGIGAGLMYLFDPREGNRRRSMISDEAIRMINRSDDLIEKTTQDIRSRARDVMAETMAIFNKQDGTKVRAAEEQIRSIDGEASWSPTVRLVTGAGGLAMSVYGLARRGVAGTAIALTGLVLTARGLTNKEIKKLVGIGAGRNAVSIQKTIYINAPIGEVYHFWENIENFPRFMEHVKKVKMSGNGISHWIVSGPAGTPVEFDTITIKKDRNRIISWKSLPNEAVKSAGAVRFKMGREGGTHVTVKMSYNPPAGAVGHAVASLFGVDPKQAMDDDLARMKSLFEEGMTTVQGEQVTKEEFTDLT